MPRNYNNGYRQRQSNPQQQPTLPACEIQRVSDAESLLDHEGRVVWIVVELPPFPARSGVLSAGRSSGSALARAKSQMIAATPASGMRMSIMTNGGIGNWPLLRTIGIR